MTHFEIDMGKHPFPSYFRNWFREHFTSTMECSDAIQLFHETTGGYMDGSPGASTFNLIFYDDTKATWFLLRYS
jgi:hypothetical protein